MRPLKGDTKQAHAFLRKWPTAFPHLVAIPIDPVTHSAGKPEARAFTRADLHDGGAIVKWISECQGRANIYFSMNSLNAPLNKKAAKADIGRRFSSRH